MFGVRIPGATFQGAPAPKPARVLPPADTPGVVMLFRPGHPASGKTGVPLTGENFNDIAAAYTRLTLGLAEAPGLQAINTIPTTSPWAFIERTSKGGIHVCSAHSGASTPYQNFIISMLAARKAYIDARLAAGDTFYVSMWGRITRGPKAGTTTGIPTGGLRSGSTLATFRGVVGWANGQPWNWPQTDGSRIERNGTAAFNAVAAKGSGSFSTAVNVITMGARDAATLNVLHSEIVYSFYIENLTASGRTFEQVANDDYLEYTSQVLSSTGMFFGDSWTEPTTKVA